MHLRIRFKPSLFQHVGKESSLKGKRQNLIVSYDLTVTIRQAIICAYWLSGRAGQENIGPEVMAYGPSDKYFPVWADLTQSISTCAFPFSFCFFFFSGNQIRNVHLCRSFWPKSEDLYSSKVVSVRISQSHNPSRAGRLFAALVMPSHTALIRHFLNSFGMKARMGPFGPYDKTS